jgi:hypothetical protein
LSSNEGSTVGGWVLLVIGGIAAYGLATGQLDLSGNAAGSPAPAAATTDGVGVVPEIPDNYEDLYRASANRCPGLDAALLAGMGWVESHHGTLDWPGVTSGQNSYGAMGPMQFIDVSWNEVRAERPDIGPDVYDPANAIPAAAHYVCKYAATKGLDGALEQYGGGGNYQGKIGPKADEYRQAGL